jgi:hypothetical protein
MKIFEARSITVPDAPPRARVQVGDDGIITAYTTPDNQADLGFEEALLCRQDLEACLRLNPTIEFLPVDDLGPDLVPRRREDSLRASCQPALQRFRSRASTR